MQRYERTPHTRSKSHQQVLPSLFCPRALYPLGKVLKGWLAPVMIDGGGGNRVKALTPPAPNNALNFCIYI